MTTSLSRGISTSMFFKLWTRAPLTTILLGIRRLPTLQLLELAFDDGAIFFQLRSGLSLEAKHESRLSVGRPNQPPTFRELDADAVYVDNIVVLAEIFRGLLCDHELLIIRAIHSDFRSRDAFGQVRQ